ncbi:MAG: thioredoxin family protein [Oxalobacter formigenes]|nr:thioredoxin family protein [Oxalobacter formigenes]
MSLVTLKQSDYASLLDSLQDGIWILVCFCAGWCHACREYLPKLRELADSRPDVRFFWVDIEEHGNMIGNLDINKFPTILIQRNNIVAFYSCIHPDAQLAERILQSILDQAPESLVQQIQSDEERRQWQTDCNFMRLLQNGLESAR